MAFQRVEREPAYLFLSTAPVPRRVVEAFAQECDEGVHGGRAARRAGVDGVDGEVGGAFPRFKDADEASFRDQIAHVPERAQGDADAGQGEFAHDFAAVGADMALAVDQLARAPVDQSPWQLSFGGEQKVAREVGYPFRRAVGGEIGGVGAEDAVVGGEMMPLQMGGNVAGDADRKVDPFGEQVFIGVGQVELEVDARMLFQEAADMGGDMEAAEGGGGDPERAGRKRRRGWRRDRGEGWRPLPSGRGGAWCGGSGGRRGGLRGERGVSTSSRARC